MEDFLQKGKEIKITRKTGEINKKMLFIYSILFIMVILTIFRVIPYIVTLFAIILTILITDRKRFKEVDYALLATFFVFFVFSGNMARIPEIKEFIENVVVKNTLLESI